MKIVILDADTLGECNLGAINALGEVTSYGFSAPNEVLNRCKGAEVVLTNKVVLDETILSQLSDLKLIVLPPQV